MSVVSWRPDAGTGAFGGAEDCAVDAVADESSGALAEVVSGAELFSGWFSPSGADSAADILSFHRGQKKM